MTQLVVRECLSCLAYGCEVAWACPECDGSGWIVEDAQAEQVLNAGVPFRSLLTEEHAW